MLCEVIIDCPWKITNCIVNINTIVDSWTKTPYLVLEGNTIFFKDSIIACGITSEGVIDLNNNAIRVSQNTNTNFDNCVLKSNSSFTIGYVLNNSNCIIENCQIDLYAMNCYSNITINNCIINLDFYWKLERNTNNIITNSILNSNTAIDITKKTSITIENCYINNDTTEIIINQSGDHNGNDNTVITLNNVYYNNTLITKNNYNQCMNFEPATEGAWFVKTLYGAKLYINGEEINYMSEKYLKDIQINIDNRVINTDTDGVAYVHKLPAGNKSYTITKGGYVPVSSSINIPTELEKTATLQIVNNTYEINAYPQTAQITVTATFLDGTQQTTQYTGSTGVIETSYGTFIEYSITCDKYNSVSGSFYCRNSQQNGDNQKNITLVRSRATLNINVADANNMALSNIAVNINNNVYISDENGNITIDNILYGTYQYTIPATEQTFATSGEIVVDSPSVQVYLELQGQGRAYMVNTLTAGDNIMLNCGMATSNEVWSGYTVDTTNSVIYNELTLFSTVSSVDGQIALLPEIPTNNANVKIVADVDDAEISFNNNNDVNTVQINADMKETHKYLAFVKTDNSVIYFKDREYPFVASENTYPSTSFTYYTYENETMSEHTATTQSSTSGDTTYDGQTLTIYSTTIRV